MFNLSDDMSHDEGPVPGGADSGDQVAGEAGGCAAHVKAARKSQSLS